LLVSERPHHTTHQHKYANWNSLTQQGNPKDCVRAGLAHSRDIVIRLGLDIENLDGLTFKRHTAGDTSRAALKLESQHLRVDLGRKTVARCVPVDSVFQADDRHHRCFAKSRSGFDQRVEHGLQIESGPADDLEHLGGGGLLLE